MAADLQRINNTLGKMAYYLMTHNCVCVSISGGSDSDIILHMIAKNFREYLPKIHFVFSNTGLEYQATHRHLDELEKKYGVTIERLDYKRGVMPIPVAVKRYGVPFLSKQVSEYMGRLQSHSFTWTCGGLEGLCMKFGKCRAALRWWTNGWGEKSRFNIAWNKGLKEFLQKQSPGFRVSAMCCQKSKKEPMIKYQHLVGADLLITGERKSEGGQRARKQSCFENSHSIDHYMPLFFWNDETKSYYKEREGIRYSDCYEVYGLKRTGCVGCPFGQHLEEELEVMQKYEPKLYSACCNVFGASYEMTRAYRRFREEEKQNGQL